MSHTDKQGVSRRDFARLVALAGWVPWVAHADAALAQTTALPATPASPDENFWLKVRDQFVPVGSVVPAHIGPRYEGLSGPHPKLGLEDERLVAPRIVSIHWTAVVHQEHRHRPRPKR